MPSHDSRGTDRDEEAASPVPIAVTRDGELAARWAESLRAAGVEAEVEIGDAQTLVPGSTLAIAGGPVDAMFGYTLLVPASDRERAARALAELGGPGGDGGEAAQPGSGVLLRGALVALAAGAAAAVLARLLHSP